METTTKKRPFSFLLLSIACVLLIAAGGALFFILFEGERPLVTLKNPPAVLGEDTTITATATDGKSGLKEVFVHIRQNHRDTLIVHKTFPRTTFWGSGIQSTTVTAQIAVKDKGIADGKAELIVTATDYSLSGMGRGNVTRTILPVVIDTRPPTISFQEATRYLRPGGSAVVLYAVDETPASHGVRLNGIWYPGFRVQPGTKRYGAYVALPYNADGISESIIEARDHAGNRSTVQASFYFKERNFRRRTIQIPVSFLKQKLPEFQRRTPSLAGEPIEQFLFLNGALRKENAEKIKEVCATTDAKQLWSGAFAALPNSARMARYADHRTYLFNNREIDQQVHLGADLASTQRAPVPAANSGIVVFADYLGIYGNTVIIDHGQGIFSLYSHLTDMTVTKGALVEKGGTIGRTGATGMAGGDHLHFSMLVHGVFVTPLEWLDPHWIKVSITDLLPRRQPEPGEANRPASGRD